MISRFATEEDSLEWVKNNTCQSCDELPYNCECGKSRECKDCENTKEDYKLIFGKKFHDLYSWPEDRDNVRRSAELLIGFCVSFEIKEIKFTGYNRHQEDLLNMLTNEGIKCNIQIEELSIR